MMQLLFDQRPHQQPYNDSKDNYCSAEVMPGQNGIDENKQVKYWFYY
jgi:hypothetical protein